MTLSSTLRSAAAAILALSTAYAALPAEAATKTFQLFPNKAFLACMAKPGFTPTVTAALTPFGQVDQIVLKLKNFKPGIAFDLFSIEKSPQQFNGQPVPSFTDFGLVWYQSDIAIKADGTGQVTLHTILADQIFGFDSAVSLAPTNTFHLGFWFNDPADAADCGFTGTTPFNGDHKAGPLAFVTRDWKGLGPLCINRNDAVTPAVCQP